MGAFAFVTLSNVNLKYVSLVMVIECQVGILLHTCISIDIRLDHEGRGNVKRYGLYIFCVSYSAAYRCGRMEPFLFRNGYEISNTLDHTPTSACLCTCAYHIMGPAKEACIIYGGNKFITAFLKSSNLNSEGWHWKKRHSFSKKNKIIGLSDANRKKKSASVRARESPQQPL